MKMCLDSTVKLAEDENNCVSSAITNIWIILGTSVRHAFPNDPANPSASLLISTKQSQVKSLLGKENNFAVKKNPCCRKTHGLKAQSNEREMPFLRPLKGLRNMQDLSESDTANVTLKGWASDTPKVSLGMQLAHGGRDSGWHSLRFLILVYFRHLWFLFHVKFLSVFVHV